MIVEIVGCSTKNKGAELMVAAAAEHFGPYAPRVRLAIHGGFSEFDDRARYGLRYVVKTNRPGRTWLAMRLIPAPLRRCLGFVLDHEVDAILDASGFALSDQVGPQWLETMAQRVTAWKRQGKRIVLMPQALGPFRSARSRWSLLQILEQVDMVFARDCRSLEHVREAAGEVSHLRVAPDFTNLVGARPSHPSPLKRGAALVVPNCRMLDRVGPSERERYLPFLAACIRVLIDRGLKPTLLLHSPREDQGLVAPLESLAGRPLDVLCEEDPRTLKGLLGQAGLVVASRYHALIGALSQGVPCLATGWSHKYQGLMDDYQCPEMLLPVSASEEEIRQAIDHMTSEPSRSALKSRLQQSARDQIERTHAMWQEVDRLLGLATDHAPPSSPFAPRKDCCSCGAKGDCGPETPALPQPSRERSPGQEPSPSARAQPLSATRPGGSE